MDKRIIEGASENISDGSEFNKKKNTDKKFISKEFSQDEIKEIVIIRDDKAGTEISLSSSSQNMKQLISSALQIKNNFFNNGVVNHMEYIG